jgi:hypothetical protein
MNENTIRENIANHLGFQEIRNAPVHMQVMSDPDCDCMLSIWHQRLENVKCINMKTAKRLYFRFRIKWILYRLKKLRKTNHGQYYEVTIEHPAGHGLIYNIEKDRIELRLRV